jgi:Holliday junction resolvase-like predicted endonuclease
MNSIIIDLSKFLIPMCLGAWLFYRLRRAFVAFRMKRIRDMGRRGEKDAEAALKAMGYKILEEQARREVLMEVNGEKIPFLLIGDLMVEKDGETSIVEVKTGAKAPNPVMSATRRQLLEYAVSFPVDSIKIYNAERGELSDIRFPELERPAVSLLEKKGSTLAYGGWFLTGLILGAYLCYSFVEV